MLLLLGCATKKQASKELVVIPQDTINTTLVDSIAKGNPVDSITKETKEKSDTVIIAPQVVTVPQIQTSETINNLPKINAPIIAGEHIYGHINVGKVLMELPEYQQAVHKMDSLQLYLAEQYKAMQIEQQTKQQELASDTTLLPMMREMKEAELQSLKDRIKYFLSYSELQLVEEQKRIPFEEIYIKSYDNKKLFGRYYHVKDGAPIQIQFHGYRGNSYRDMCGGNKLARENKFNTLVIDQRAHGKSQGNTITFGVKESKDCLSWINYVNQRFNNPDIYLVGVSMGASTILLASQYNLASNIKAIIADCPFSSTKQIIRKVVKDMKLPVNIIYPFIELGAHIFGRFNINDGDVNKAICKCKIPVLLIHGQEDELVPVNMAYQIKENNKELIQLEIFENAKHGVSYFANSDRYVNVVTKFINNLKSQVE